MNDNKNKELLKIEKFTKELNKEYGLNLTADLILRHPTLRSFSEYIIKEYYEVFKNQFKKNILKSTSYNEEDNSIISEGINELKDKAINYFKKILSATIKLPVQKIEADAQFDNYGIDSVMVIKLTNELENIFGTLPKTLFFEYRNLKGLSDYFLKNYYNKLIEIISNNDKILIAKENLERFDYEIKKDNISKKIQKRDRFSNKIVVNNETKKEAKVAIIGISGRYPEARDIEQFWENLRNGRDCITEIPENRWNWKEFYDEDKNKLGKSYSKWGGFLEGVDEFDPLFFNISPRDAEYMDPQERIFLECAYKTLEDAGYTCEALEGKRGAVLGGKVGVFTGVMYEEYQLYGAQEQAHGRMISIGGNPSSIANRVSYTFNFQGPSMAVDTMCSSSLTAIHLACQCIERGECETAIAGGVNVSIHPNKYLFLSQGKFVSSKGRCESFGKGGDGYVPGEGVGAVLLKPLSKAEEDGDHIYGIIRSSMLNAGGKTNGYTVPNPVAQGEVIREAMERADVNARSVSYIEAHGTGTLLGDPIEIAGLTRAFRQYTEEKQYCAIGSVKSNIGHCESAAGIAALTKVLLQMKHGELVPNLHSEELNPNINFNDTPFVVQRELAEWKKTEGKPRIAGISSFGAGGANAHIIIEEYVDNREKYKAVKVNNDNPAIIVLSARDEERLKEKARDLIKAIEEGCYSEEELVDIAYTLQVGREGMEERLGFIIGTVKEMEEKLKDYINGEGKEETYRGLVKRNNEEMYLIANDEEMKEAVEKWVNKKKYGKLLELWVKGLNFDWNRLYEGRKPQKISLPGYPFARERYWISISNTIMSNNKLGIKEILKNEKIILSKEWIKKDIKMKDNNLKGLVFVFGTGSILEIIMQLFKEYNNIQVIPIIQSGSKIESVINTDFYSISNGEKLYQQFINIKGKNKLLGIIDITALDVKYENTLTIESGKIKFIQKLIENNRNEGFKLLQLTYRLNNFLLNKTTLQGARLAGLYRMLSTEYKQIESITMDCDGNAQGNNVLIKLIQNEFLNRSRENLSECCYRNEIRYEPKMVVIKGENEIKQIRIQEKYNKDDVVIITGGSRGIGAAIAEHIISMGLKKIVIMGREELPDRSKWKRILDKNERPELREKIKRMQSYIERGVKVHYSNASLMNEEGLVSLIQEIHQSMGLITGVFYCAGIISKDPAFIKKELTDIESVYELKTKGMVTLHRMLEKEPLSFYIMFSSISSIVPILSVGQSDYAAANSYMDYYAFNQEGAGKRYIKSIQWPAWGETGMAKGVEMPAYKAMGMIPMTMKEGLEFLDIAKKISKAVIAPCKVVSDEFNIENMLKKEIKPRIKKELDFFSQQKFIIKNPTSSIKSIGGDLKSSARHWVKEIIMNELKLTDKQIDEDKPFDEYGIDSVIIAQITQTFQKQISTQIAPSIFLENRTIRDLSEYFIINYTDQLKNILGVKADQTIEDTENLLDIYDESIFASNTIHAMDDIAVVGISCRFPGASTKEDYWDLLIGGKKAIKHVPKDRWQTIGENLEYGGWIEDIGLFDPEFFNLKDDDATVMDPQARLMLEESLKSICDAGYEYKDLSGKKIGVYIGGRFQTTVNINAVLQASNPILGLGQNYLAANISKFFNFTGPSLVVDTACSSGLTAISMAMDSLKEGRINMGIAGAINLILNPYTHKLFAARNILSQSGEFHIFDKKSDGEVLGEGAGTVILKRLSDAVRDGNKIYGIIKAISVNNDGRTLGPGSPNIDTQKQVMREALILSREDVNDVGYIEVNGGGSPIMDSIEIKALSEVYNLKNTSLNVCAIGSVKPNIGHLLLTSGLAGFIRCMLSLYNKQIPPFLSATDPFDYYDFKKSRILFNRNSLSWDVEPGKKRVAVQNSFPDGGTNCHIVFEEFTSEAEYEQNYFSIPVPVLNKKKFPLTSEESINIPGNEEIDIKDLKNKFRKKHITTKDKKPHKIIQNVWGINQ